MDSAIRELISRTPNHLVIDFDDFVNLRQVDAISQFIERELDTSLVDAAQVSVYKKGSDPFFAQQGDAWPLFE
jgi:hypothetical protein